LAITELKHLGIAKSITIMNCLQLPGCYPAGYTRKKLGWKQAEEKIGLGAQKGRGLEALTYVVGR